MQDYKVRESADYISRHIQSRPEIALVLGSGLGELADLFENTTEIPYSDIAHFPTSTVPGHDGKLVFGKKAGKTVMAMKGRFHYYEGYSMQEITYPVRVMQLLGVKKLIVTNAAGGVNEAFSPGDLMLITDHIKLFDDSPLRGRNEQLQTRFPDMSCAYPKYLRELAKAAAAEIGVKLCEGVYFYMPGPSFETPAEIRAIRMLGADAVGMSTVPEVIEAVHAGIDVLGISNISNMAAGILPQPITHEEVIEAGKQVQKKLTSLLAAVLERI